MQLQILKHNQIHKCYLLNRQYAETWCLYDWPALVRPHCSLAPPACRREGIGFTTRLRPLLQNPFFRFNFFFSFKNFLFGKQYTMHKIFLNQELLIKKKFYHKQASEESVSDIMSKMFKLVSQYLYLTIIIHQFLRQVKENPTICMGIHCGLALAGCMLDSTCWSAIQVCMIKRIKSKVPLYNTFATSIYSSIIQNLNGLHFDKFI